MVTYLQASGIVRTSLGEPLFCPPQNLKLHMSDLIMDIVVDNIFITVKVPLLPCFSSWP